MTEKMIPLLRNIKTKEPSVTLAALAVYAEMGKRLGHDVIATDILPALWPMTVGVLLNMEQVLTISRFR
jgi:SCY1-like protein 2